MSASLACNFKQILKDDTVNCLYFPVGNVLYCNIGTRSSQQRHQQHAAWCQHWCGRSLWFCCIWFSRHGTDIDPGCCLFVVFLRAERNWQPTTGSTETTYKQATPWHVARCASNSGTTCRDTLSATATNWYGPWAAVQNVVCLAKPCCCGNFYAQRSAAQTSSWEQLLQ